MIKETSQITAALGGDPVTAFDWVISPLIFDSFLSKFWGKSFVHLVGRKGKFESLFSWAELNRILEQHRLPPSQLKLVRDGRGVDVKLYMAANRGKPRLNSAGLINQLSDGATLIIDNIDELAPAVFHLTQAFEDVLQSRSLSNLYASWRTQKGFDLHWDDQDTFILQVSGRKHWKVYPPTRLHPLTDDAEVAPAPTGEPAWEGILEDGDAIYLPRGWWHVAFPLDEPSLHLTVTLIPADGTDFLLWLVERLKSFPEVRMNVPHLGSEIDHKEYVRKVRQILNDSCDANALETFIAEWEVNFPLPTSINLPYAPEASRAPITPETNVRLSACRRLVFLDAAVPQTTSFVAGGIRGECPTDLVPALAELRGTSSCCVAELAAHLPDESSTSKLIILLTALAMRGVLQSDSGKSN